MRLVVLELGRTTIAQWEHDGHDAHAGELPHQIAEIAGETVLELERDCSFQLTGYDEKQVSVGSAPLKVAIPEDTKSGGDLEGPAQKHVAMLLRHNEQLQQRLLTLTEQQSAGLTRALDAQGRVLDALSARLAHAEKLLQSASDRENDAQAVARDAVALLEGQLQSAPNAGFKNWAEKIEGLIELAKKAGELREVQQFIDGAAAKSKGLNGAAEGTTPPATQEQKEHVSSDGGGR